MHFKRKVIVFSSSWRFLLNLSSVLPTYADIMRFYNFEKQQLKNTLNKYDPSHRDIVETVSTQVEQMWDGASIPHVSNRRVQQMLNVYHKKYRALLKPYKSRKDKESYKWQISEFQEDSTKLFDICTCKCKPETRCQCEKSQKVPQIERDFLNDQRGPRSMIIAGLDQSETVRLQKRFARRRESLSRLESPSSSKSIGIDIVDTLVKNKYILSTVLILYFSKSVLNWNAN